MFLGKLLRRKITKGLNESCMVTDFSSKRIAKNTIALYFRMILLMLVSLYTSRVVLRSLGVVDYGIYNVVGGLISMFSILSISLTSAISRYITFEVGRNNISKLREIFSTSLNVMIIIGFVIVFLIGIIGVIYICNLMNLPKERLSTTLLVFLFSLLTFYINFITISFNSLIIAHEKMGVFAYISIFDAILKLLVAYSLSFSGQSSRLELYSLFLLFVAVLIRFIYGIYCKKNFEECKYSFVINRKLIKEMLTFAGWNLYGNGIYIFNIQGVNLLSNYFFGVVVNAARGLTTQIDAALKQFTNSFMMAINPQIIKLYAVNDLEKMHKLLYIGAKISFFLGFILFVPIFLEIDFILTLWLGDYPIYTKDFVRWSLLITLLSTLSSPLTTAAHATGKIKWYDLRVGTFALLVLPFTYFAFLVKWGATSAYIVYFIIYFFVGFVRVYAVKNLINLRVRTYISRVFVQSIFSGIVAFALPYALYCYNSPSLMRVFIIVIVTFFSVIFSAYVLGFTSEERLSLRNTFNKYLYDRKK